MASETRPDRGLRLGVPIALAILAIFVVIVITTVDDRGEIGQDLRSSFRDEALAGNPVETTASLHTTCEETGPTHYRCTVEITGANSRTGTYEVTLRDSGCWTARLTPDAASPRMAERLRACVAGT